MKTRFLFPHQSRLIGYIFIFAYIPIIIIKKLLHDGYTNQNLYKRIADSELLTSEHIFISIATILLMTGLLLIAFSKEIVEDEQISQLRLDSLQWAIYFSYFIFIVSAIFISGMYFKNMMLNVWAPLIFFIVRFRWVIFLLNRSLSREG